MMFKNISYSFLCPESATKILVRIYSPAENIVKMWHSAIIVKIKALFEKIIESS